MIRVRDIKISINAKDQDVVKAVSKKLKIRPDEIVKYQIFKKSVDARNKKDILFTYTIDVKLKNESNFKNLKIEKKESYPSINLNSLLHLCEPVRQLHQVENENL